MCRELRILEHELAVDAERLAVASLMEERKDVWSQGRAGDPFLLGRRKRLLDERLDVEALRRRLGEDERGVATEPPVRARDRAASSGLSTLAGTGGPPCAA